jgi:uncharacterized Zn finger protein
MAESHTPPLAELVGPGQVAGIVDAKTLQEGSALANNDNVELVETSPYSVTARVRDGDTEVEVRLDSSQSGLQTRCSCDPGAASCRHAAGVAFTAWKQTRHGHTNR